MATATEKQPLNSFKFMRRRVFNRAFAAIYTTAIFALLYHHALTLQLILQQSKTSVNISISITMLIADFLLGFMWFTRQSFRMNPLVREVFPENLEEVIFRENFPTLDIFICTADPFKEPPLTVVNTALSVMAYDYPTDKISVYVSDDGGSQLTLFAFMEAAEFGRHWLPFCRENKIMERCPDAYFRSNCSANSETQNIKMMYESMKMRVESVMEKGKVTDEYITSEQEHEAFSKWTQGFTRQQHPSVIQVLLESCKDKDITGNSMPNLIYLSREKSKASPHHFKAGALNALLRVSAVFSNAPVILTQDCDMFSNDPWTPHRVLCFLMDHLNGPNLGYIQFPQIFHGLNKADTYGSEYKYLFQIHPLGMDGLKGPNYVGSGCFFRRRIFFGGPESFVHPGIPELSPDYVVKQPIKSEEILKLANRVAGCNYENHSNWGSEIGFKYGSLVEDYYTGYRLLCEGWQSIFCDPKRPAFLGDIPITLNDVLGQNKRWCVGLLEVVFSKYNPFTYGVKAMGLEALCFGHYSFWPFWSIPITIYAFLPQLTLLNNISIFPKVSDPWFFLYAFLFIGAHVQHCLEFILGKSTFERWWNDQRMWLIKGPTCFLFGTIEYLSKLLGIPTPGFHVTSKVVDDEQGKRYDQGIFEFGVLSPMFVLLTVASTISLIAFLGGLLEVLIRGGNLDALFIQLFIAGFVVLNSLPIYEAMFLRADKGKMPTKITVISAFFAFSLCVVGSFIVKM